MGHIPHLRKLFIWFKYHNVNKVKKNTIIYFNYENLLVLHLKKLESPSYKDASCQVWLKLAQWFWRRRWKCEKFTTTMTTTTTTTKDNGQFLTRKAHLSLRLSWAKNPRQNNGNIFYQTWQINSLGIDLFQFWRKPKEENNDTDDFLKYTS